MSELRTVLPNARVQPRFAGISTFCRFPLLAAQMKAAGSVDWAIYGFPFDGGVTFRPGTRFGPRAIREASQYAKPYSIALDVNVCEQLSLADAGDSPVHPYSVKDTLDGTVEFATAIGTNSTRVLAVGGDHSLAYANTKASWIKCGQPKGGLAMIHFDSHVDTIDVTGGSKWTHASPFRRLIEDGIVDPKRMISMGIKGPLNSKHDLDFAREHGIELVTYYDFQKSGMTPLLEFLKRIGSDAAYVSFDIDCIDPAFAPGTGTPCVGGFTSVEAFDLVRCLATGDQGRGVNLVGADLVEVLPDRDSSGMTSFLAAHVMMEILCVAAIRARSMRS